MAALMSAVLVGCGDTARFTEVALARPDPERPCALLSAAEASSFMARRLPVVTEHQQYALGFDACTFDEAGPPSNSLEIPLTVRTKAAAAGEADRIAAEEGWDRAQVSMPIPAYLRTEEGGRVHALAQVRDVLIIVTLDRVEGGPEPRRTAAALLERIVTRLR